MRLLLTESIAMLLLHEQFPSSKKFTPSFPDMYTAVYSAIVFKATGQLRVGQLKWLYWFTKGLNRDQASCDDDGNVFTKYK